MKKLIYVFLLATSSALILSSCNDEEVSPKVENSGGGFSTGPIGPKRL